MIYHTPATCQALKDSLDSGSVTASLKTTNSRELLRFLPPLETSALSVTGLSRLILNLIPPNAQQIIRGIGYPFIGAP